MVMCPDHPGLTFNLSLVRTEPTYNQPIQQWTFVSDFAVSELFLFEIVYSFFLILHLILNGSIISTLRCVTTLARTQ